MEKYELRFCLRSEEGEWYYGYDSCFAMCLTDAVKIVADRNDVNGDELMLEGEW